MARDWCVVLDAVSPSAARRIGDELKNEGVDVDIESGRARVWCFADDAEKADDLVEFVLRVVAAIREPTLQIAPMIRTWSDEHHRYVDPAAPDEDPDTREVWIDSELGPGDIGWRVRLNLTSVFEFRRVRHQLPALRRPIIDTGNRHIDLGARDETDALDTAARAESIEGVAKAELSPIGGRVRRWLARQRLAGNYSVGTDGSGPGYGYGDVGGHGGDGGGGGGGHDGGGGHGGH